MLQKGYNNVVTSNANSVAEKFQYNGKEIDEDLGLNWHDYGARRYDASLGRFMTLDPFAEKYSPQSVYAYAANNPIIYVDVFGMGPGDPPYTKNNVTFIHFDAPTISVVNRQSGGTFTSAAIATDNSSVSNEYVVNMQQYETLTYKAKLQYVAGSNIDVGDLQTQGLTIVNGEVQEGGRTSNSYYVAQCADGSCQAGLGNPPADSKVGFGGGIPLIVDGMAYGAKKKYDSNGKMIQNSSRGFAKQNSFGATVGKTILAFDNDGNFMIVSQQDGVEGMTLAEIRDYLKSEGYTNAISFDGSTSATLVKDKKVINKPDERKNNSIPVGARINE